MADKAAAVIKENFAKNLKPLEYAEMMAVFYEEAEGLIPFTVKFYKDVLESGKFKGSTSKMLEIGSGALVHNMATASAFYPNIVMSDFVEANCDELKRWLRGESPLEQFLDVPAQVEGYGRDLAAGRQLIERRIRQRVKQVVRCDLLDDNVLQGKLRPEVEPPYDLVLSSACVECAVPDVQSYGDAVRRMGTLLRPGGGLILVGFIGAGVYWPVKDIYYHHLSVTENDVIKAVSENGFKITDFKIHDKFEKLNFVHEKYYCLAAEKI